MQLRLVAGALLVFPLLLVTPDRARATSVYAWGFDLDQISTPRYTEAGFQLVTTCTISPGIPTPGECAPFVDRPDAGASPVAGYVQRAPQDFRVLPLGDPAASPDLWADGHRVIPGAAAVLRISGLPAGMYQVHLFSADPNPTVTRFELNGTDVGTVSSSGSDPDLGATGTLIAGVEIDSSGILDIRYSGDGLRFGTLNGVGIIPEPASIVLLGLGLGGLGSIRRGKPAAGGPRLKGVSARFR